MKVKIDLSKEGLAMFYRPYEIIGWDIMWNSPEPIGSVVVWTRTNVALKKLDGSTISRASVIFFLNRQVDLGFMGWKDATGKGGHHRLYYPQLDLATLVKNIWIVVEQKFYKLSDMADEGGLK